MTRRALIWAVLLLALAAPVVAAAFSPLLAWRDWPYIAAGFAGILGMVLIVVQAALVTGVLPGLAQGTARRIHRVTGTLLVVAVLVHVGGLWVTSPPDVIDALTFTSPTPFSAWGVIAMWAAFGAALLAVLRKRLPLRPVNWRRIHAALAVTVATGTVVHALLIEGTMETITKLGLSALVLVGLLRIARLGGLFPRLPFGNGSQRTPR